MSSDLVLPVILLTPPEIWVIDASPFIGLAKIGRLDLLAAPGREVMVPEAVAREVRAGPIDDAWHALSTPGFRIFPAIPILPELSAWHLGAGEEATLAAALNHPGALAVVDDTDGRRAARAFGLPVAGTTGILVRARRAQRIEALSPLLRALQSVGLFLPSDDVLRETLLPFGEIWPSDKTT